MCPVTEKASSLEEQRDLYEKIYKESTDGMLIIEGNKFVDCNDAILKMLKYKEKLDLLNTHPSQLSPTFQPCGKTSLEKANEKIHTALEEGKNSFEWVHKKSDGETFWVAVVLTNISTENKERIFVSWRDIDDKKKLEEKLINLNNELERKTKELNNSIDTIRKNVIFSVSDTNGIIVDASEAFSRISGYTEEELIGKSHNIIRHPDMPSSLFKELWITIRQGREWKGNIKNLKKDGSYYWVEATMTPKFDKEGNIDYYTAVRHDITAEIDLKNLNQSLKESEEHFKNLSHSQKELANTDPLTGISNRRFFFDIANNLIKMSFRTSVPLSMLIIDIDFFKKINDTYGHLVGDDILQYLTRHIKNCLRKSDVFARFGGEEFVVLLPETDLKGSLVIAKKLRLLFSENRYEKDNISISFTISIGVSQYKNEPLLEEFIQKADEALYQAKNNGRNRVESYNELEMKNKSSKKTKLVQCDVPHPMSPEDKVQELTKQIQRLNEYKKAVDQSTIISKSDKNGVIIYVNDAFVKVSGYPRDELIGHPHNIIRHPDNPSELFSAMWKTIRNKQTWQGILKNHAKDGSTYYVDTKITPILSSNGKIEKFIAIRHDITKVFEQEQLINRQLTDSLTGLPNRLKLMQDLEKKQHNALTLFNLDAFQEINKLYGHKVGDDILKSVAVYLLEALSKEQKQIYKLPGDVFAILCIEACDEDACKEIIMPLIQKFSENLFHVGEHEIYLNMTAGVSYGNDIDILINANIALNNAKKNKLPFAFYNLTEQEEKLYASNQKMIKSLKYAISNDQIVPYFQPIYNNDTLEIDKYEVLMRLIDQEGEVISPFFFLDISHKVKIYPELTKTIIRKAFAMFQDKDITFSINLTIEDIRNTVTQTYIIEMLNGFNRPHNVVFEIVESEEIEDYAQIKVFVQEVKKYGAKIAIDDFGSGYSNFMHLLELETDFIKIDGSIIKNILHDKNSQILIQTIVSMANKLDMKVIAEFVSSKKILDAVISIGIDHSQGYYLGEPKPILA